VPELPEVETVRRGLDQWVVGRTVLDVEVRDPRAVRRQVEGPDHFARMLSGRTIEGALRRGKYLWLPLDGGDALVGHLGMSGQLLVREAEAPAEPHLRVRFGFVDGGRQLRFVDQRTFGGLAYSPGGATLPAEIAHIARDPLDPCFDSGDFVRTLRSRRTAVKRALLDQKLVSGIGNIYADEVLWLTGLHWARPANSLSDVDASGLLEQVRDVLRRAVAAGGTSFDELYVDVNGQSGYFARSLFVYGREGQPCRRCATPIRREPFANRSAFSCPTCQPPGGEGHHSVGTVAAT
jgi:formamidopyrimidine-DNA glycosylase